MTSTQAGTTATFTAPGVAVYENFSLTVTTVRSPITSLSLCPQSIINPTYTITGTIPSDWTWGCPPGSRCNPPKIDCNYEVLPADTYYCSPDECVPVYALPSATASTIPFSFVQDYIYLNPSAFGLSVDAVFDVETTLTSMKTYKSTSTACKSSHSALCLPKLIFQLIHRRLLIPPQSLNRRHRGLYCRRRCFSRHRHRSTQLLPTAPTPATEASPSSSHSL